MPWACAGQGYASPFGGATGPTAWIAPGVVAIYALSFALWGCFTFKSVLFVFSIALVVSLITTVVVFRIGERVGGNPDIGFLAALFFACLPYEAWIFQIAGHLDLNLQVLWFAVLLLAVLRSMDLDRPLAGLALGTTSAVAALFNPSLLLCTGVGFVLAMRGRSRREIARFSLLLAVAHILILGPYVVFQGARLGGFVPVKSNAGFELYLGNTREARGVLLFTLAYAIPYLLTGVMERYRIPMTSAVALALALLTWTLIESYRRHRTSQST